MKSQSEGLFTGGGELKQKPSKSSYDENVDQIFNPMRPATGNMFIARDESDSSGSNKPIDSRVLKSMKVVGKQILIFGDSGVGKTNLVINTCIQNKIKYKLINVQSKKTLQDLLEKAIRKVDGGDRIRLLSQVQSGESLEGQNASVDVPKVVTFEKHRNSKELVETTSAVEPEPLEDELYRKLAEAEIGVLIFDNLQNFSSDEGADALGELMEYFSDLHLENPDFMTSPKIVAAGIARDSRSLIGQNVSRYRRIEQIRVPRMQPAKIQEIAKKGFLELGLSIDEENKDSVLNKIAFYSDGFPYFAQAICAEIAKLDSVYKSDCIKLHDVEKALVNITLEDSASIDETMSRLQQKKSTIQLRTRILKSIVRNDWPIWTSSTVLEDLKTELSRERLSTNQASNITTQLNYLAGDDVGLLSSETVSGKNQYRFRNPHFRPYLRMRIRLDECYSDSPSDI